MKPFNERMGKDSLVFSDFHSGHAAACDELSVESGQTLTRRYLTQVRLATESINVAVGAYDGVLIDSTTDSGVRLCDLLVYYC